MTVRISKLDGAAPTVAAPWQPGDRVDGWGTVIAIDGARVQVAWDTGGVTWHRAEELFPEVRS